MRYVGSVDIVITDSGIFGILSSTFGGFIKMLTEKMP